MTEIDDLSERIDALEASLAGARGITTEFEQELQRMSRTLAFTGREVDTMSRSIGHSFRRAFDGIVFDGMKLSDAMRQISQSMINSVYSAAMRPVQGALGGAVGGGLQALMSSVLPFADGGAFSQGRVIPFAQGGVVSAPVAFPMRGGQTGLMGEAGPEAILPLARGADGRLGVQASGAAAPVNVVINISTPDVEGFRRSEGQVAAQIGRLIARGQRNR